MIVEKTVGRHCERGTRPDERLPLHEVLNPAACALLLLVSLRSSSFLFCHPYPKFFLL